MYIMIQHTATLFETVSASFTLQFPTRVLPNGTCADEECNEARHEVCHETEAHERQDGQDVGCGVVANAGEEGHQGKDGDEGQGLDA